MCSMNNIVIIYDDDPAEVFGYEKNPIDTAMYWIERRLHKSSKFPKKCFICSEEIDVSTIINKINKEQEAYEKKEIEQEERRTLEKLKKKYE